MKLTKEELLDDHVQGEVNEELLNDAIEMVDETILDSNYTV